MGNVNLPLYLYASLTDDLGEEVKCRCEEFSLSKVTVNEGGRIGRRSTLENGVCVCVCLGV